MANFTVRVELHDVEDEESLYGRLHEEMKNAGFFRSIRLKGVTWELPSAEYSLLGDQTVEEVLRLAVDAARAARETEDFSVLVTKSLVARGHYNLKKLKG